MKSYQCTQMTTTWLRVITIWLIREALGCEKCVINWKTNLSNNPRRIISDDRKGNCKIGRYISEGEVFTYPGYNLLYLNGHGWMILPLWYMSILIYSCSNLNPMIDILDEEKRFGMPKSSQLTFYQKHSRENAFIYLKRETKNTFPNWLFGG